MVGKKFRWQKSQTPRAKRIPQAMWEEHKDELCRLYHAMTLDSLIANMREKYAFTPSRRQYIFQFEKWGFHKYNTPSEGQAHSYPISLDISKTKYTSRKRASTSSTASADPELSAKRLKPDNPLVGTKLDTNSTDSQLKEREKRTKLKAKYGHGRSRERFNDNPRVPDFMKTPSVPEPVIPTHSFMLCLPDVDPETILSDTGDSSRDAYILIQRTPSYSLESSSKSYEGTRIMGTIDQEQHGRYNPVDTPTLSQSGLNFATRDYEKSVCKKDMTGIQGPSTHSFLETNAERSPTPMSSESNDHGLLSDTRTRAVDDLDSYLERDQEDSKRAADFLFALGSRKEVFEQYLEILKFAISQDDNVARSQETPSWVCDWLLGMCVRSAVTLPDHEITECLITEDPTQGSIIQLREYILETVAGGLSTQNGMRNSCLRSCLDWCKAELEHLIEDPCTRDKIISTRGPRKSLELGEELLSQKDPALTVYFFLWESWQIAQACKKQRLITSWGAEAEKKMGISGAELLATLCWMIVKRYTPKKKLSTGRWETFQLAAKRADDLSRRSNKVLGMHFLDTFCSKNSQASGRAPDIAGRPGRPHHAQPTNRFFEEMYRMILPQSLQQKVRPTHAPPSAHGLQSGSEMSIANSASSPKYISATLTSTLHSSASGLASFRSHQIQQTTVDSMRERSLTLPSLSVPSLPLDASAEDTHLSIMSEMSDALSSSLHISSTEADLSPSWSS